MLRHQFSTASLAMVGSALNLYRIFSKITLMILFMLMLLVLISH